MVLTNVIELGPGQYLCAAAFMHLNNSDILNFASVFTGHEDGILNKKSMSEQKVNYLL